MPARQAVSVTLRNGERPIGATSRPKKRSRIVALPTTTTSRTSWRSIAVLGVDAGELVVEGAPHGAPQLARALGLVRDPADDVAAAEPLRVLEGADGERLAGL